MAVSLRDVALLGGSEPRIKDNGCQGVVKKALGVSFLLDASKLRRAVNVWKTKKHSFPKTSFSFLSIHEHFRLVAAIHLARTKKN